MKKVMTLIVSLLVLCWTSVFAIQSPLPLLKKVSGQMVSQLEKNKSSLSDPAVIHKILNTTLVPHLDLDQMSANVVGPSYWRQASPSQRRVFKQLFLKRVISTYGSALSSYDGDVVKFYPLRGGYSSRTITVRSMIVRKNGQQISVNYNLVQSGNTWKVFDFSVENISIISSFRAQFASIISRTGNLNGLISRLQSMQ